MNLCLNTHYRGSFLFSSLKLIHAVLGIALGIQDVLMALSLSLLMLVRESFVSLFGLFCHFLVGRVRIIFNSIFFIWSRVIFFLLWLSRYCSVASIEKLASQDLIKAKFCSHGDRTIFLNLLFYLSLINSFNNGYVLVFFSFMASDKVPAPPP